MGVKFSRSRSIIPPPSLGSEGLVQRRVEEAALRAAERTRIAVTPDSYTCRLWARNPRGTIPCPCSTHGPGAAPNPAGDVRVVIHPDEGDMLGGPDNGYPLTHMDPLSGETQPDESLTPTNANPSWLEDVTRLLLGNGRRCGLCWGTGWINGHKLWGGARLLFCAVDDDYVTLEDDTGILVDVDSPTPTFVGPGYITWNAEIPSYTRHVDALRVREGLSPAKGYFVLEARTSADPPNVWRDAAVVVGCPDGCGADSIVPDNALDGLQFRLKLGRGVRVSHVELVLRSEPLVHLQLPQIQQAASQELIAPFVSIDFEVDPSVGALERGSLFEIPGVSGRLGSVWVVTDVTVKQTTRGSVYGVIGNVRNAQPTDVVIAALMDDSSIGLMDGGVPTRGLEATTGGQPSGVDGYSDESEAASKRGVQPRAGGGSAPAHPVSIVLSSGRAEDEDLP